MGKRLFAEVLFVLSKRGEREVQYDMLDSEFLSVGDEAWLVAEKLGLHDTVIGTEDGYYKITFENNVGKVIFTIEGDYNTVNSQLQQLKTRNSINDKGSVA